MPLITEVKIFTKYKDVSIELGITLSETCQGSVQTGQHHYVREEPNWISTHELDAGEVLNQTESTQQNSLAAP